MQASRMRWVVRGVMTAGLLAASAQAQQPQAALPPDLASVPDVIKSGKWKDIDLAGLSPLEHCRALLVLNHVLDELAPVVTAQADLMSAYLDQEKLGAEFTEQGPPLPPPRFTIQEGLKIAVALMRGPLAQSDDATAFADMSEKGLQSYRNMYEVTCERKWSEVTEGGRQVRCMGRFLKDTQRWDAYQSWLPGETDRREKQYEQEKADRRAARATAKAEKEEQQRQDQLAATEQANQQLQAQNAQLQQSLVAAQQQMASQPATIEIDDDGWGSNFYGVVSNVQRAGWARDAAYGGAARAATGARISGWHGGGRAGGRGRR